ncbi:MAG: hypothetical protein AB7T49_10965 [Oligoflexales bacterium]
MDHMPVIEAKASFQHLVSMLKPSGRIICVFCGDEPLQPGEKFQVLEDGTRFFIEGPFKGSYARYWSDAEILGLANAPSLQVAQFKNDLGKNAERMICLVKV